MKPGQKARIRLFKIQTRSAAGTVTSADFVHQTHFQDPVAEPTASVSSQVIRTREVS